MRIGGTKVVKCMRSQRSADASECGLYLGGPGDDEDEDDENDEDGDAPETAGAQQKSSSSAASSAASGAQVAVMHQTTPERPKVLFALSVHGSTCISVQIHARLQYLCLQVESLID